MLGVGQPAHPHRKAADAHALLIEGLALILAQFGQEPGDFIPVDQAEVLDQLEGQPARGSLQRGGLQLVEDLHPVAQVGAYPLFGALADLFAVGPLQHVVLDDIDPGEQQALALDQRGDLVFPPQQLSGFRQSECAVIVRKQLLDPVLDFLDHRTPRGREHRPDRTVHDRWVGGEDQAFDMADVLALDGDCAFLGVNLCVQLRTVHQNPRHNRRAPVDKPLRQPFV